MRIAIWHNLPSGGAKRSLYYEVRELVRRGHHVEAWCPTSADATYLPLSELIPEHRLPLDVPPHKGLARLRGPYGPLLDRLRAMDAHCRAAADQINRGGFDLLFGQGCMLFRTTAISRFVDLPKTIYLGEPYRWLYEAMPDLPWAAPPFWDGKWWHPRNLKSLLRDASQTLGYRIQMREEVRNARAWDSILSNSLYSRESFLRAYGVSARLRYPGIDTELFVHQAKPREPFVIGLGALIPEKNPELIIRAVGTLAAPRPRLIWVGNVSRSEYQAKVQQLARECGVELAIKVRISDAELVDLLNRATAMLYAPRLEPFGLAPLEANACATPVIAVAEGGVRETIRDGVNGWLVEHDPAAMGAALAKLWQNPAAARELGAQALRFVQVQWSLPASIDRLEHRFHEVIAERAAAPRMQP